MKNKILVATAITGLIFSTCQVNNSTQNSDSGIQFPLLGKVRHKTSNQISNSYWGVQAGSLSDSILKKAAELGVKWTRLHAKWEEIEQVKGIYSWNETDEAFDAVLKYGITPFVTLGNGNALYSGIGSYDDPKLADIYGTSPAPPTTDEQSMQAWLAFVEQTVGRYKNKINHWEIWNEPNHRKFWGAEPNATDYGRLVKVTAEKIREIQPGAIIIAGSMAGMHANYADEFLSACDPINLDVISFHNYSALPEDRIYRFTNFYEAIQKHNPELEIWQGECGYPSHSRTTGYRGRAPWGLNIQAKWLLRQAFVDTYFCKATLSNYFILSHSGDTTPEPRNYEFTGIDTILGYPERGGNRLYAEGVNQKCILFREDASPKPAFMAYRNLCAVMDDKYKIFITDYEIEVVDEGVFYGIGNYEDAYPSVPLATSYKTENNQSLIAYWLPWNPQEDITAFAKINLTLNDIYFENPVLINLLNGNIFEIENSSQNENISTFGNLPLSDSPFLIAEKSLIDYRN